MSPERRNFEELYGHLLKPMISKSKLSESKTAEEKALIKDIRKWHREQKEERQKSYAKVKQMYQENLQKLQDG